MNRRKFFKSLVLMTATIEMLKAIEADRSKLEGVRWNLVSFGYTRLAVPANAWMELKGGRFRGNAGCNGLGGSYRIKGNRIRFRQDPSTQLACPVISLEVRFRKLLNRIESFEIKGRELLLKSDGRPVLIFSRGGA